MHALDLPNYREEDVPSVLRIIAEQNTLRYSFEGKNEKAAEKIFRHLGDLLVGRRDGLGCNRLLSDLVESGKCIASSKADRK
ncbi:MAG: hypothetical protein DMG55_03550 [Acidobacteria bacterium]|nr:MAG: hypothetical protein DMG55_03550 [Acidobacteriota bacterium]